MEENKDRFTQLFPKDILIVTGRYAYSKEPKFYVSHYPYLRLLLEKKIQAIVIYKKEIDLLGIDIDNLILYLSNNKNYKPVCSLRPEIYNLCSSGAIFFKKIDEYIIYHDDTRINERAIFDEKETFMIIEELKLILSEKKKYETKT